MVFLTNRMTPSQFKIVRETDLEAPPVGRPRILVAEDEPTLRRILVDQLADYEVLEAADGVEALELIRRERPEVVLLDWLMPKAGGLEVCRAMRAEASTSLIPVVLLTGRNDEASKLEALGAGVNEFVTKPFSFLELQHRIRNMVKMAQTQKELAASRDLLVRAEKLSSLGELGAGIMHEINNPLNYAITGLHALKMMSSSLEEDLRQEYEEVVDDIEEGLGRVSQIAHDLRTFARMGRVKMERVELGEVVRMSERLVAERLRQVDYESRIEDGLFVHASAGQLSQVVVNLLINAVDALAEQGRPREQRLLRVTAERKSLGIYLSIWDKGCGIAPELKTRLFDPFFTTKGEGKGMGLGLSVCYRILEAHGARLEVDSRVGEYTRFYTILPYAHTQSSQSRGGFEVVKDGADCAVRSGSGAGLNSAR